ncbi:MAG: hypothetical protein EZS28_026982, partial [Streblomastix strix]
MVQVEPYNREEIDGIIDQKLNISDQIDAYSKQEDDALLLLKADKTEQIDEYNQSEVDVLLYDQLNITDQIDAYNKSDIDALLDEKLNISYQIDAYSKIEDDALLLFKADKTELIDAYNNTEVDALLDDKLNITDQIDEYSKQEDDSPLLLKADKTELDIIVNLTSSKTIIGGGDMLVSSLVSQLQLQEVRDIASDQENVAKLATGDNLFIDDKQIMDYWWEGIGFRALQTELLEMSNVITILGAATGGSNAITDLSLNGNTLIPAKNSSFITNNYDETITGQRYLIQLSILLEFQFKITIIILFDQIDTYTKTQDDALLLLKADKTQLIDACTKDQIDNLLNNKADSGVSHSKGEDDALLLLKADKTQLIHAYTKGEA